MDEIKTICETASSGTGCRFPESIEGRLSALSNEIRKGLLATAAAYGMPEQRPSVRKRLAEIRERRVNLETGGENFDDPLAVAEMMKNNYRLHAQAEEHMYIAAMTSACEPLGVFETAHGWVNGAFTRPGEVFIRLLLAGASGFVLCHNHPSGDCRPSEADKQVTQRLKECADFMAAGLFEHIIIGDRCFSFKVNGML